MTGDTRPPKEGPSRRKRGRPPHPDILTPREWQILSLLRQGLTNEQIALRLDVSVATAKYHVSEILSKLGVTTREQAAAWQPPPERRRWCGAAVAPFAALFRRFGPWTPLKTGGAAGTVTVLAALGVLALQTLSADDPQKGEPPPGDAGESGGSELAYLDGPEVWLVNADGSDRRRLIKGGSLFTGDCAGASRLSWSPNGENLACFIDTDNPALERFVVYSADGKVIAGGVAIAGTFTWALDGRWAFALRHEAGGIETKVSGSDGDPLLRQLGGNIYVDRGGSNGWSGFAESPVWGPDGRLAFYNRSTPNRSSTLPLPFLATLTSDGRGSEYIPGDYRPLAWVLGGRAILGAQNYAPGEVAPTYEAVLVGGQAGGSSIRRVTRVPVLDNGVQFWISPDGSRAIARVMDPSSGDLAVLDFDNLKVTPIPSSRMVYPGGAAPPDYVVFSPNGSQLYWFDSEAGIRIWTALLDGSPPQEVGWLPHALTAQMSPDLTKLAYVSNDRQSQGVFSRNPRLWVSDRDGTASHEIAPVSGPFAWRPQVVVQIGLKPKETEVNTAAPVVVPESPVPISPPQLVDPHAPVSQEGTYVWDMSTRSLWRIGLGGAVSWSSRNNGVLFRVICCSEALGLDRIDLTTGSAVRMVTSPVMSYTLSPDSEQIAFTAFGSAPPRCGQAGQGPLGLYLINQDGTGARQLSDECQIGFPTWSPQGDLIAFQDREFVRSIDVSSGESLNISAELGPAYYLAGPSWSPDGQRLAFCVDHGLGADPRFPTYVYAKAETRLQRVADDCSQLRWSPDSSRLLSPAPDGIVVLDAVGSEPPRVLSNGRYPTWSPDGEWIAYISEGCRQDGTLGSFDVHIVRPDGGPAVRLTDLPDTVNEGLSWSPAGDVIAFASFSEDRRVLLLLDPESSELQALATSADLLFAPGAWSNDGRYLAFNVGTGGRGICD